MIGVRDRWAAAAAIVVLTVLAAAVVGLVLDAQRAGIETREDLRLEQVAQLAGSMDTRVQQAFVSIGATAGVPGRWSLEPGDPADAAGLRPTNPQATTGALLVDRDGTLVNGSLLQDPSAIGRPYDRAGLKRVLQGEPTLLPVAPGLTTPQPVLGLGIPARDLQGGIAGAYVLEIAAAADSAFAQEVNQLQTGESGSFSFVDAGGAVVASSETVRTGRPSGIDPALLAPGFHRRDGRVYAAAEVPSAGWSLVFEQSEGEFQGNLTGPLRWALLLVLLVALVGGTTAVVALTRRLQAARVEQRRLAEISRAQEEFTSIVSHELRTPVAGLLGFLQTTIDHWEVMDEDERRAAVQRAQQNAERLQQLTVEVLDTTAVESGAVALDRQRGDLRDVVAQAVDVVRDANPGRVVELRQPDEPVPVDVDPARIRQVVVNLLDNAVKSSPLDRPIDVVVAAGDPAAVCVRDRGPGVAEADRERIFTKFTRMRSGLTRGSGLGLYLAREIVEAHGGRIWVANTDGPGATLQFTIPAASERSLV